MNFAKLALATFAAVVVACSGGNNASYSSVSQAVAPYTMIYDYYEGGYLICDEAHPFTLNPNQLLADQSKYNCWATIILSNGCLQHGQFATQKTVYGKTKYEYVARYVTGENC